MAILISWKRLPIFILYKNDRHLGINILQDGGYVFAVVNLMYISLSLHATLNAKGYTQKIEQNQSFVQLRGAKTNTEATKALFRPVSRLSGTLRTSTVWHELNHPGLQILDFD